VLTALFFWSEILYAQPSLPVDHPKVQATQRVFDDLVLAFGDRRTPPQLHMVPRSVRNKARLAWYNPQQHRLTLEERAYDLCVEHGADSLDALAFLLGHELAHFYENHGWVGDFGNGFADLQVGQTLQAVERSIDEMIKVETQADYVGGFYGYLAGYRTLDVAPILLRRIYQAYALGDQIPGYPALAERQEIARRAAQDLHRMIPIFDASHRVLMLLHYETAARCFEFIARSFNSREILNNAGVARALQALALIEPEEEPYVVYPFEVDGTTRLAGGKDASKFGYSTSPMRQRQQLLEQARTTLERARQQDPEYPPTYINLACVTDLLGQADEAALWAQQALNVARRTDAPMPLAHALIARGITKLHGTPPDTTGSQDFIAAQANAPLLARFNLAVLDKKEQEDAKPDLPAGEIRRPKVERIGGLAAMDYRRVNPEKVAQMPRNGPGQPAFTFYRRQAAYGTWLILDTSYTNIAFLETQAGYGGATDRGVRIGDERTQVETIYGLPAYLFWTAGSLSRISGCRSGPSVRR